MLILSVALVVTLALGIGFTAAIWTSTGNGMGDNTVAPATDSPFDWNPWAKYFAETAILDSDNLTAAVSSFHTDDYSLNLETVIIPNEIVVDDVTYKVVEITNQVFSDATLKELAVVVYIPPNVRHIDMMAFSNLPNLTMVVFGLDSQGEGAECVVDDYAFMMCPKLANVVTNGRVLKGSDGATLTASSPAFSSCSAALRLLKEI